MFVQIRSDQSLQMVLEISSSVVNAVARRHIGFVWQFEFFCCPSLTQCFHVVCFQKKFSSACVSGAVHFF